MTYRTSYPRDVALNNQRFTLRFLGPDDESAVLDFARCLPEHDLLFLPRDITEPRVVKAWIREANQGGIITLLATKDERVVGSAALIRDVFFWSKHVGELRIVTAPDVRHSGLGRTLLQELFAIALSEGIEKVISQMTTDQVAGIAIFEGLGFRPEALLREHVKDRSGRAHNIVMMGNIVAEALSRLEALGVLAATTAR